MNVLIFGASGMLGQGVLRECLAAADVARVGVVVRRAGGLQHPKLVEIVCTDFYDYAALEPALQGYDACFFCLGVSSLGMSEADYVRQTYDLTLAAATALSRINPHSSFVYVSGTGTDSSEQGRVMWARVKGRTENALLRLPFRAVWLFRPGAIQPLHGIRPRDRRLHLLYVLLRPVLPLMRRFWPDAVLTTAVVGRAMLQAVRSGWPRPVLEAADINALGSDRTAP